jgi:hypothetical protein
MAERAAFDFEEIHFLESFLAAPEWRGTEWIEWTIRARSFELVLD